MTYEEQAEEQVPMGTADRVSRVEQHIDILANRVYKLEENIPLLRDYFAAAAMTAVADGAVTPASVGEFAEHCYAIADAMLAEREE